jgi:Zn finger protein HypA/HybF involved in hydrogenase expression
MASSASFGFECKTCGSVVGVVIGTDAPICPNGHGAMAPATSGNAPQITADFRCKHCGTRVGLMIGGSSCPTCGKPID